MGSVRKVRIAQVKVKKINSESARKAHEILIENDYELLRFLCRLPIVGEEAQELSGFINRIFSGTVGFEKFMTFLFQEKIAITRNPTALINSQKGRQYCRCHERQWVFG